MCFSSLSLNYFAILAGVQEGTLYLLKEGVLFFKPPMFIPSDEVASIMAGRGGSAQTRYIDLNVSEVQMRTEKNMIISLCLAPNTTFVVSSSNALLVICC